MKYLIALLVVLSALAPAYASKRYFAVDLISSTTVIGTDLRPSLPDGAWSTASLIPTTSTGGARFSFCIVIVSTDAAGYATINAYPHVVALPIKQWADGLSNAETNQIKTYLTNHGLDASDIPNGMTFGQVLRMVGRKLDANFDDTTLDANSGS